MPPVSLIFPPLVWSAFESLYPSTAVLSAFLKQHGIEVVQEDLNDAFVQFLMDDPMLDALGAGRVAGVPSDSVIAAAARWARHNKQLMFDEQGRQLRQHGDYGHVIGILARPFFAESGVEDLLGLDPARHPSDAYVSFYEQCAVAQRLAPETALIGISVPMGPQLLPALLLADHLKKARPDVPVVLGGPTLSLMDVANIEALLTRHPTVDCVVRFDGEFPLLELTRQALHGRWEPGAVAGVSCLSGGSARHNAPGPGPDINQLPPPDYHLPTLSRKADPALAVIQARGCYWGKCDYCDFIELFDGSPPFRGRRPENFVDEIEGMIERTGVRRFRFITESIPPAFARRVSQIFLSRHTDLRWGSFAMVDRRFDRDLLGLMVEAGCEHLIIGLETMNTRVLKLVHKSADREQNIRFLRDARDAGLRLHINLIPDLPSTTYEEARAALDEIRALSDCLETVTVFPFEATRSSNVGRHPERFGLVADPASDGVGIAQYALNHYRGTDPAMTADERAEIHREYRRFAADIQRRHATGRSVAADLDIHAPVRVPVEELDIFPAADSLVCTQIRTSQRVTIRGGTARLLAPHTDGKAFMATDLKDNENTLMILKNLDAARILVQASAAAS